VVCAYIIFAQWLLFLPIAHIIIFARHFFRLIVCGNQGKSTAGGEGHQTAVEWVAGRALNHSIAAQPQRKMAHSPNCLLLFKLASLVKANLMFYEPANQLARVSQVSQVSLASCNTTSHGPRCC